MLKNCNNLLSLCNFSSDNPRQYCDCSCVYWINGCPQECQNECGRKSQDLNRGYVRLG
jgi:hypothetical protein